MASQISQVKTQCFNCTPVHCFIPNTNISTYSVWDSASKRPIYISDHDHYVGNHVCEHLDEHRKAFDGFMKNKRGMVKLEVDDHFDVFARFGYLKYSNTELPVEEKESIKKAILKKVRSLSPVESDDEERQRRENWDDLLEEFRNNNEEQAQKTIDTVMKHYKAKKHIKINEDARDTLHLICADEKQEDCVVSPRILSKIIRRYQKLNAYQFAVWYAQYIGDWGFPWCGEDFQFIVIHPDIWNFLLGCMSATGHTSIRSVQGFLSQNFRHSVRVSTPRQKDHMRVSTQQQIRKARKDLEGLKILLENTQRAYHRTSRSQSNSKGGLDSEIDELVRKIIKKEKSLADLESELKTLESTILEDYKSSAIKELQLSDTDGDSDEESDFQKGIDSMRLLAFQERERVEPRTAFGPVDIHPAMDRNEEMQQEVPVEYDVANNTALATAAIETPTVVLDQAPSDLNSDLITDQHRTFPALTDRFVLFDTLQLDSSIIKGTVLKQYHLPYDFIAAKWKTPNMLPFKTHEFFKGSMTIKLQANIPKTNQIYLRYGVVYHWLQRDRRDEMINAWTISQQPGGRINSHIAASDEIEVPFFSYVPNIPIRPNSQMLNLYNFTLSIVAYTAYEVAEGAISTADLNVYAKFNSDLTFYGQIEIIDELPNFTIPTNPKRKSQKKPQPIKPAMFSAIAVGAKGVLADTMAGVAGSVISTANNIVSGTIRTATSTLTKTTERAVSQGLAALGSNRDKPTDFKNNVVHQRAITNLASGSGNFEADSYRLQEVGSTTHPDFFVGVEKYTSINKIIETEGFVNSMTIRTTDVQGTSLGVFKVQPGVEQQMIAGGNFTSSGTVNYTPLDHMANWFMNWHGQTHYRFECVIDGFKTFRLRVAYVPNRETLTYQESDSAYFQTFDVGSSLDAQPSFDFIVPYIHNQVNFNTTSQNNVTQLAGSIHIFVEVKINMPAQLYNSADIIVFKRAVPGAMTFTVPRNNLTMLKTDQANIPDLPDPDPPLPVWERANMEITFSDFKLSDVLWNVAVTITIGSTSISRNVGTLTGVSQWVFQQASMYRSVNLPGVLSSMLLLNVVHTPGPIGAAFSLQFVGSSSEGRAFSGTDIINGSSHTWQFEYQGTSPVVTRMGPKISTTSTTTTVKPAMDIREASGPAPNLVGSLTPLDMGAHGESHMHLYENLRRFSTWHNVELQVPNSAALVRVLSIPLNLGGALFREDLANWQRADKITHIHDAFRFFRGSTRYMIQIHGGRRGNIRVVHKPQVTDYPFTLTKQKEEEFYCSPGFGESVISLQQNNISVHETPMYLPTSAVLTASYLSGEFLTNISQGLGTLDFYWQGLSSNLEISIMRALGDDAQFYMFNGFPLRVPTYETRDVWFDTDPRDTIVRPAMHKISPAVKIDFGEQTLRSVDKLNENIDNVTATIQGFLSSLTITGGPLTKTTTLATQIAHVVINPSIATFAISCIEILNVFGLLCFDKMSYLSEAFRKVYAYFIDVDVEEVRASMDKREFLEELSSISATVLSAVVSIFSVKTYKDIGFMDKISAKFSAGANIHQRMLGFIKALLGFTDRCVTFVCKKFFPNSNFLKYLEADGITTWIKRCNVMTDTTVYNKISKNRKASGLVYRLVKQGEYIQLHLSQNHDRSLGSIVGKTLTAITRVRDKLGEVAHIPVVKFDPFCFYIASRSSQIGKSEMLSSLCMDILKDNNIAIEDKNDFSYIVPESDTYWTGYKQQEVIIFDDFNRLTTQEAKDSNCAHLTNLKGEASWEVPKAFQDKGAVAVPKLIACASNHAFPTHNGIKSQDIVWSRRNALYTVVSDMSCYPSCDDCNVKNVGFSFACARCKAKAIEEKVDFSERKHLTFTRQSVTDDTVGGTVFKTGMTFGEFREDLREIARIYYGNQKIAYEKKQEEYKEFVGAEGWNNLSVPSYLDSDMVNLIDEFEFAEIQKSFTEVVRPSMFRAAFNLVSTMSGECEERKKSSGYLWDADNCWHECVLRERTEPYWAPRPYWIFDGEKVFDDDICENDQCYWNLNKNALWEEFYEKKVLDPKFDMALFPIKYNQLVLADVDKYTKHLKAKIMKESWYSIFIKLTSVLVAGVALISLIMFGKSLVKKTQKIITKSRESKNPNGLEKMHPALMTSGDVQSKFHAKLRSLTRRAGKIEKVVRPAGANEYEAMVSTYERSIVEMEDNGQKVIARCVCISPKVFLTQLHSFCCVIKKTADCIALEYAACDCDSFWTVEGVHSPECVKRANDKYKISFSRAVEGSEEKETVKVSLQELFEMNAQTFGVDSSGSDMVVFTLDLEHFRTQNIGKYLLSESDYNVDFDNIEFYDPGRIGKKSKYRDTARNVNAVNSSYVYPEKDCADWAPGANEVEVKLYGFSITNPKSHGFGQSCGSVLMDKQTVKIIGIMSASSKSNLFFNGLSKEQVESAFGWHAKVSKGAWGESVLLKPKKSKMVSIGDDMSTGCLVNPAGGPHLKIYHSTKTSIKPSVCYQEFGEVKRRPCNISQDGDKGEKAMSNGLKNYYPHKSFPQSHIDNAFEDINQMFLNDCFTDLEPCSKRSINEAVCGINGHIPRLTMSTSPGFPWCCKSSTKRKSDLIEFSDDRNVIGINEDLKNMLEEEEEMMENGLKPLTIFQLSHKDERLELSKLDNVRLIQGSPLSLTLSSRRYLMDFNYAFSLSRRKLEHCVGINPESMEWDELARELVDFSPYLCVGDYSKFGPRLLNEFVSKSYKIMTNWYSQFNPPLKHQVAREMLGQRVINSLNMCYNIVVEVKCGSPSGAINTVVVNSICNMFYIRCAWQGIMKKYKPELSGLHHFKSFVKFFCYGDDVIFSVKPEIIDIFNNQTIHDYFAEYGVKYTDVTKGDSMRKHCTIEEASFLKRKFSLFTDTPRKPGVWIAKGELDDIVDTTNWVRLPKGTKTGSDQSSILMQAAIANCEDAVRRVWFHGKDIFYEFQTKVHDFFRSKRPTKMPIYYTFEGLQRDYGIPVWEIEPSRLMDVLISGHGGNSLTPEIENCCSDQDSGERVQVINADEPYDSFFQELENLCLPSQEFL